MLRMDEINKIRKEFFVNQLNPHQIAIKFNRSWATVNEYLSLTDEEIRLRGTRPGRKKRVVTPEVVSAVKAFLKDEKIRKVPRKQRFSSEVICKRLKEQGIFNGSARTLRNTIRQLRSDLKQHDKKSESFLELDFPMGHYLQVDHGEVEVEIDGIRTRNYLFVATIPGTSIRYCQFYMTKRSEAWGHFHEQMFGFFSGVFEKCVYDNDSVLKVPSTGKQTKFCLELQIHYGFDAIFCNKGSGHEKGAVEGSVGYCRRNYLAGIASFKSIDDLNYHLSAKCQKAIAERTYYKDNRPLSTILDEVRHQLKPLPPSWEWGHFEQLKVDKFQCIQWKEYRYSVPEMYIGSKLKTYITATKIIIYDDDNGPVACHDRRFIGEDDSLILDHYLDQLKRKPTAIPFAKVLKKQPFPDQVLELRQRLRSKYGVKSGDLEFIEVLFLKRQSSTEDFNCAVQIALSYGGITATAIKSIIKQLQISQTSQVIPLNQLAEQCSIDIEHQFNLGNYDKLAEQQNRRSDND